MTSSLRTFCLFGCGTLAAGLTSSPASPPLFGLKHSHSASAARRATVPEPGGQPKDEDDMGEIAELHVMAFEAGLDPNEMDGADWADFLENESGFPPNPWLIWHEAGSFLSWLNEQAEEDGDTAAGVLSAYFPQLADPEAVLSALQSIAAHTDPEDA